MKVDGMDAGNVALSRSLDSINGSRGTKPEVKESSVNTSVLENRNLSNLTEFEKKELPISDKVIIEAIEKANKAISTANRKFEYSIHEKTKEIMIKVIDSDTNEVIREIPPEKVLDMVAKMWEMAGLIVDERR